ncbi:hypothetical protein [uncultured Bosea sp.]|uniref:hypothetical protein n=1 Tax=uncultured Bosea sp. TaxID=211457 RepID=UPI00263BDEC9|nr:hypothetical protein [uncultured Bosea sp.]
MIAPIRQPTPAAISIPAVTNTTNSLVSTVSSDPVACTIVSGKMIGCQQPPVCAA